jgi:hypothetical protein
LRASRRVLVARPVDHRGGNAHDLEHRHRGRHALERHAVREQRCPGKMRPESVEPRDGGAIMRPVLCPAFPVEDDLVAARRDDAGGDPPAEAARCPEITTNGIGLPLLRTEDIEVPHEAGMFGSRQSDGSLVVAGIVAREVRRRLLSHLFGCQPAELFTPHRNEDTSGRTGKLCKQPKHLRPEFGHRTGFIDSV